MFSSRNVSSPCVRLSFSGTKVSSTHGNCKDLVEINDWIDPLLVPEKGSGKLGSVPFAAVAVLKMNHS